MPSLHEFFVVVSQKLRIDLADQFHHDTHDDDKTRTGDDEVGRAERGVLREEQRNDRNDAEEGASPEVHAIAGFCEESCSLGAGANAGDEASPLLDGLCHFLRLERDGHVEECEAKDEQEVEDDVEHAGVLRVHVLIDEAHDRREARSRLQELRNDGRERDQ